MRGYPGHQLEIRSGGTNLFFSFTREVFFSLSRLGELLPAISLLTLSGGRLCATLSGGLPLVDLFHSAPAFCFFFFLVVIAETVSCAYQLPETVYCSSQAVAFPQSQSTSPLTPH